MKQVLKFIVSIIVIVTILFTVYALMKEASQYVEKSTSGDNANLIEIISGDKDVQKNPNDDGEFEKIEDINDETETESVIDEIGLSGNSIVAENMSGELFSESQSSDETDDYNEIELKVNAIKLIENQNKLANVSKFFEDNVGVDIIGVKNKDFFESFDLSELTVTVQIAGSMVYIIPNSDFIDNEQYHYDENGKLVLYIRELIGIGGQLKYYFEEGRLLKQEVLIEEEIQIDTENIEEILKRAKNIHEKYMK